MQLKWNKNGLIELTFLVDALIWIPFRYQDTLNLLHPEWIILGLGLGFLWCLRHKLYIPLFLFLLIAGTLLHQWFVVLPNSLKWLQEEISAEEAIMLNGKIQECIVGNDTISLQLNSVDVIKGEQKQWSPEAILSFPENSRRNSSFFVDVSCR